jgi:hypothetical protein
MLAAAEIVAAYTFDYQSLVLPYLEAAQAKNIPPDALVAFFALSALVVLGVINLTFTRPKQQAAKDALQQARQKILTAYGYSGINPAQVGLVGHWGWQSKPYVLIPEENVQLRP